MQRLPAKAAKVFSMKELLGARLTRSAALQAITKADYWQSMSRARKQLQLCLNEGRPKGGACEDAMRGFHQLGRLGTLAGPGGWRRRAVGQHGPVGAIRPADPSVDLPAVVPLGQQNDEALGEVPVGTARTLARLAVRRADVALPPVSPDPDGR